MDIKKLRTLLKGEYEIVVTKKHFKEAFKLVSNNPEVIINQLLELGTIKELNRNNLDELFELEEPNVAIGLSPARVKNEKKNLPIKQVLVKQSSSKTTNNHNIERIIRIGKDSKTEQKTY